jgi:hypothetical protein
MLPSRIVVYVKRRETDRLTGRLCYLGIPVNGELVDTNDLFVQGSKGLPVNDVVHAKVVDSSGCDYSIVDCSGGGYYFQTCCIGNNRDFLIVSGQHRSEHSVPVLSNYVGDHPRRNGNMSKVVTFSTFGLSIEIQHYYATPKRTKRFSPEFWIHRVNGYNLRYPSEPGLERTCRFRLYPNDKDDGYTINHQEGTLTPVLEKIENEILQKLRSIISWRYDSSNTEAFAHICARAADVFTELGWEYWNTLARDDPNCYNVSGSHTPYVTVDGFRIPTYPNDMPSPFLFDEDLVIGSKVDPMLLGKASNLKRYHLNAAMQHTLLAACESFPKLNDNTISNVIEIVGFIKALVIDHRIDIPKSLQSAWLSYRYVYTTTKLDMEEAIHFVHRRMDLGDVRKSVACYATESFDIEDVSVLVRCSLDISPKELDTLATIWNALDTYGLTPDFYVIWDSIPYSFIVDWFIPIGDLASVLDADVKYFSGENYSLENLCYSLEYTRDVPYRGSTLKVHCYSRWSGDVPAALNGFYWLESSNKSKRTIVFRILDALALTIK